VVSGSTSSVPRVGGGDDGHSFVPGSLAEPFGALAELQQEGWIAYVPYVPLGGFTPLQSGRADRRRTRLMVQLAAILAAGGLAEFRAVGAAAVANGGVSPVELKEIVYQSVAYVGMARVFDYLHAVNDVLTEAGVELPLPGQSASTPQTRLEYGQAVQGRIVGDDAVAARLADTPADEVHFQRYLAANCFGDTVGRGGIALEVRELLTFSMLVALGGADAQVRGHVHGNLRVGNTRARLLAVLTVLVPFIGYPRTLNGLAALNAITGS
jgi:4-carboxymuconolactone decarboxylase